MSATHPQWNLSDQVQKPALADFDELLEIHPVLLREVMASLPPAPDFTSLRGKFLALREWVMLSSAFDIRCHVCQQQWSSTDVPTLWFPIGKRWISETHVETGLFPRDESPGATRDFEPPQDRLLRWHINLWLIQIEAAFQAWWRTSPNAVIAMLRPNTRPEELEDISEQLLIQSPDLRAKSVATNTYPYRGRTTAAGRVFLYLPAAQLVKWRLAQDEGSLLQAQTPQGEGNADARRL